MDQSEQIERAGAMLVTPLIASASKHLIDGGPGKLNQFYLYYAVQLEGGKIFSFGQVCAFEGKNIVTQPAQSSTTDDERVALQHYIDFLDGFPEHERLVYELSQDDPISFKAYNEEVRNWFDTLRRILEKEYQARAELPAPVETKAVKKVTKRRKAK